jgi:hypothetical protein
MDQDMEAILNTFQFTVVKNERPFIWRCAECLTELEDSRLQLCRKFYCDNFQRKDKVQWSCEDVVHHLWKLGLQDKYSATVTRHVIDGYELVQMTQDDLVDLGFSAEDAATLMYSL